MATLALHANNVVSVCSMCGYTRGQEAQLSTDDVSVFVCPVVIADGPPDSSLTHFHPPLCGCVSIHQSHCSITAL